MTCSKISWDTKRYHWHLLLIAIVSVALLVGIAAPARGADGDFTDEQNALISKIEGELIAPCCWTQTVEVHDSQKAEEIKMQVTLLVSQGKSEDEILDTFVDQYGEEILAAPRASGFNLVAYVLPFAVVLLGLVALSFTVLRWRRTAPVGASISSGEGYAEYAEDTDGMRKRLEDELSRFDQ